MVRSQESSFPGGLYFRLKSMDLGSIVVFHPYISGDVREEKGVPTDSDVNCTGVSFPHFSYINGG